MSEHFSVYRAEVNSFYSLPHGVPRNSVCSGTACFVASDPEYWNSTVLTHENVVKCLGKCYISPSSTSSDNHIPLGIRADKSVLLENLINGPMRTIDKYLSSGGTEALRLALSSNREDVLRSIDLSGLRGRGGAGFPTGKKWKSVAEQETSQKYVVMNGDEGDPGSYIDRMLLESNPYLIIEAMTVAGYAVGSNTGYAYIRGEYPGAISRFMEALREMTDSGYTGNNILGGKFSFNIKVIPGKGSYVCGEETALMRSIEGLRPEASIRPPYPTEKGLFGKPTLVNNVETLANVPWILQNGPEIYSSLGYKRSRGTKLISLNSLFRKPGVYEVEFGTTLEEIVNNIGGGLKRGKIKGMMLGGPLSGIVHPDQFNLRLDYEELRSNGTSLGHGGIIAFDESMQMMRLIQHVTSFAADESCGKCTPCRLGSRRLSVMFSNAVAGKHLTNTDRTAYLNIISSLNQGSLCGLGVGLAELLLSIERNYSQEMRLCFT